MSDVTFDFNLFLKDSKETLLNPKSYFSTMKIAGGIAEPLIKAVIYGTVAGLIYFLWGMLHIGVYGGLYGGGGFRVLISSIIGSGIGVFIGGVIFLVISSICKGNTDFEANLRVSASVMVLMPISAFLSFAGGLNIYLGVVVSLVVFLYSLWLLFHGIVESLKGQADTAKIVCYVLAALIAIMLLLGLNTRSRFERTLNRFNSDTKEILKDLK
jgi:hypothetical protein